jgi:hypothetical protein
MTKSIKLSVILLVTLLSTNQVHSQNSIAWGHKINFQFEIFNGLISDTKLSKIDFFTNSNFPISRRGLRQSVNTNSVDSSIFKVNYSYAGIGGSSPKKVRCPDIFLRLEFQLSPTSGEAVHYEKLIRFIFETVEGSQQLTTIDMIDLENYVRPSSKAVAIMVNGNGSYSIVEQSAMEEKLIIETFVRIPILETEE